MQSVTTVINKLIHDRLAMTADHVFLYNNYDLTEGSILLFLFKRATTAPFAVLKLSRNRSILLREYENLKHIREIYPGIAAVPLFFDEIDDYHVLCTEPLNANRLTGTRAKSKKLGLVTARLSKLHLLLQSQSATTTFSKEDYLQPFTGLYETELPVTIADYYNDLAAEFAHKIEYSSVRKIPQHGDLYFDNVLTKGRQVYFLDWEDFGAINLPGYDLFSLVFDVCNLQDEKVDLVEKSLDSVARCTEDYFRSLEIPAGIVGALMAYTLVQQYCRSWTQGRTSKEAFRRRLVFLADNKSLLMHMTDAYSLRW